MEEMNKNTLFEELKFPKDEEPIYDMKKVDYKEH